MTSSFVLVHSQFSIEVRQFLRTNFIKSLLTDYKVQVDCLNNSEPDSYDKNNM